MADAASVGQSLLLVIDTLFSVSFYLDRKQGAISSAYYSSLEWIINITVYSFALNKTTCLYTVHAARINHGPPIKVLIAW